MSSVPIPNDAAKAAEGPQFIGKSCRLNDALTFFETDQSQGKNADGGCDRTVQFGKERLRRKSNATHFQPGFVLPVLITIGVNWYCRIAAMPRGNPPSAFRIT